MNNDDSLPPIPCPVCDGCDHDLRSGILELTENIGENLKTAAQVLLDGMEAANSGSVEFQTALLAFVGVRKQIDAVLETIPEIAYIKMVHTQ